MLFDEQAPKISTAVCFSGQITIERILPLLAEALPRAIPII